MASESKWCPMCGETKPLSEFPKRGRLADGSDRYGYCKPCHTAYQRRNRLSNIFNITEDEYDKIVAHQSGVCFICLRPPKTTRLAVDHDHKTGLVRGALCWSCNRTLGFWREDTDRMARAVEYLANPPAVIALGEARYGRIGRSDRKSPRKRKKKGQHE